MLVNGTADETGRCLCCSICCAACKLLHFLCMHQCCPWCVSNPQPPKPEFSVLCLGLSGAGKSTLMTLLTGETIELRPEAGAHPQTGPTMGFSIKTFLTPTATLHIKELGGAERIRPYWSKYYAGNEAIIFVVDSSSLDEELLEAKACLENCLSDKALQGLPLLVLCNKQDLACARNPERVMENLGIRDVCQERVYRVEGSSSKSNESLKSSLDVLVDILSRKTS